MKQDVKKLLKRYDDNMSQIASAMTRVKLNPQAIPDDVRVFLGSLAMNGIVIAADVEGSEPKPKKERKPRKPGAFAARLAAASSSED